MPLFLVGAQTLLVIVLMLITQPKVTASYYNYLTGKGAVVLDQTVGTLEMIDGERFLSNPDGQLKIIITYGELPAKTLGTAWRGNKTCRIVINHIMNPETSVTYDESDLRSVLVHEIGHCFGMDHFSKEDHIMFWAYDGIPHTYAQLEEFIADLNKMRQPLLF